MSFYKLSYSTKNGEVIDLPGGINKHADIDTLKDFAREAGYAPEKWGDNHDNVLRAFFGKATLAEAEIENPLNNIKWEPFWQALEDETALFNHDESIFKERIKNGVLNGILDGNGKLISTINVMPKITSRIRDMLHIEDPNVQVYETGAGWFERSHRGLGLYTLFRRKVLATDDTENRLIFSQANGKGASMVNIRDQWALVPWKKIPFASALMGWRVGEGSLGNQFLLSSGLHVNLPSWGLYQGSSIKFDRDENTGELSEKAQAFLKSGLIDNTMKLWVNDLDKAKRFEANIRHGLSIHKDTAENVVDHVYQRQWLAALKRDAVYKPNGNGGQVAPSAIGWGEFTGAATPSSDAA